MKKVLVLAVIALTLASCATSGNCGGGNTWGNRNVCPAYQ